MEPLISIIVPVYNTQAYVAQCIESILSQSFSTWELLLIDDGSSDKSGVICDAYAVKDERIKVFHIANKGASYARFGGVQQAKGKFILFVDSDDSIPQSALEDLYSYCIKNEADITVGGYTRISNNQVIDYCGFSFEVCLGNDFLYSLLTGNWKIYGPVAKLFKKELFSYENPTFPKEIRVGEDLLMNVFLASHAQKVVFIPSSVYNYHQITTSATHTFTYTLDYMNFYLGELEKVLLKNSVSNAIELLTHYRIIIMYNVLLDDVDDKINYRLEYVTTLSKKARDMHLTSKERLILFLLRCRFARIFYRRLTANYRRGNGFFHCFRRMLKK